MRECRITAGSQRSHLKWAKWECGSVGGSVASQLALSDPTASRYGRGGARGLKASYVQILPRLDRIEAPMNLPLDLVPGLSRADHLPGLNRLRQYHSP